MLTSKQNAALQALLTNPTRKDAAKAAGIDPKTLKRYLDTPDFQKAYREAANGLVDEATRYAQQTLSPAIEALVNVAKYGRSETARVAAARALLEFGLKFTEFNDVLPTLEAVEGEADVL